MNLSTVTILGAGVIGTSIALALRRNGIGVRLSDPDSAARQRALALEAGTVLSPADPPADVVVVACPPSAVVAALAGAMRAGLGTVYTDVASAKERIVAEAAAAGLDMSRYVPGHPVAAGDIAAPAAVDAEMFAGRPWFLCASTESAPAAVDAAAALATACGARVQRVTPKAHDRHMAGVSHVPRLIGAALAARFADVDGERFPVRGSRFHTTLADAAAAPALWGDTLEHNADHVADELDWIVRELSVVADALRGTEANPVPELEGLLARGRLGHDRVVRHGRARSPRGDGVPGPEDEWFWTW
ncbi:prephenate dehydrogenase/arogenate dehydrogenase family protein [Amycolatopsis suaedae]|uniref:prephenate dehydrogenase/arogenate dehydrogenase family protein n=1 Tax=Amycolatopsis suaedae TaxID=2510978 RepID=UPI0013EF3D65|nr:prephenate dehydrogenase/arogenate dehydrogenase family protein [Amycolatopsis suaedae]